MAWLSVKALEFAEQRAAFRFGPRAAATGVLLVSAIAIWRTVNGFGPFVAETVNESLLLLLAFVGVVTVTILATAAIAGEHRQAERDLRQSQELLEARGMLRTIELSNAIGELRTEVARRKKSQTKLRKSRRQLEEAQQTLLGHQVVCVAETGRELVDRCRALKPDLVITDIQMPDMDGLDAAAQFYPGLFMALENQRGVLHKSPTRKRGKVVGHHSLALRACVEP